jgi:catechol-2,3-dioxygenase
MPKKGQTMMQFGAFPLAHLGLRVSDLGRAKRFYIDTLGFGLLRESAGAVFMDAHGLLIALLGPTEQTDGADRFDPFRVGLDHLALTVADVSDLDGLRRQLDAASVPNHGIEQDPVTGATYISFYDPDGIAWELYAMPSR